MERETRDRRSLRASRRCARAFAAVLLFGAPADADGPGPDAVPAIVRVPVALPAPGIVTATLSGAYGFTESMIDGTDTHHRVSGTVAAAAHPVRWLSLGFRLDGRYDVHITRQDVDDGFIGDPRVFVRVAGRVGPWLGLGVQANLWIPSQRPFTAPLAALTPEFLGTVTIAPIGSPVIVSGLAGFRLDRSAASAPDAAQLSMSDRIGLGLNASHAMLLGLGGSYRAGPVEMLAEWQWDLLVGPLAPNALQSPMHVRAGLRLRPWSNRLFWAALAVDVEPALRASVAPDAPLVAIDPRITIGASLSIAIPFVTPVTRTQEPGAPPGAQSIGPRAVLPRGVIRGHVLDEAGLPVRGAVVRVTVTGGVSQARVAGDDGAYAVEQLAPGTYQVVVSATGRPEIQRTVEVGAEVAQVDARLGDVLPPGQVRGTVRTFAGVAVSGATVRLEELGSERLTDTLGGFEIDAAPGEYTVVVSARGFRGQRRTVRLSQNGVLVLNIDLEAAN